jgi:TonB-dependent receptor
VIVGTGIRGALTEARQTKRNAEVVMDSLSAADIGALPDRSVSEALQRIPGITLQRTDDNRDPARLSGEGGGVFVRGLSWVRTEFNGRDTFSANSGRSLNFEDVSADLLGGVDVIKNPSADMIEGGVGGTVNLKTRKPLDEKRRLIALSGDYNYADLRKTGFWSGNGLYSNRWDVGNVEVGLLLSASLGNVGNRSDSIQTGNYGAVTPSATIGNMKAGSTYYVPSSLGWRSVEWTQKRTAYDGVLQIRPMPDMTITAEGFISKATPHDIEHAEGVYGLPTSDASYKFNNQNVLTSGTYSQANMDLDTRVGTRDSVTRDFSLKLDYRINRHWKVTADVQRIASETSMSSFTAYSEFGAGSSAYSSANRPTLGFDLSGSTPTVTTTAANGYSLSTQSNYWWAAAMDHIEHNNAYHWAEKADVEYDFDDGAFLKSINVGLRSSQKDATTRQTNWNWSLLSAQFWGGGTPVALSGTGTNELFNYSGFMRGNVSVPGVGWFPSAALMNAGTAAAYPFLKGVETASGAGWGWSPLTEASYTNSTPGSDNPTAGVSRQKEKTWAGYAMLRFGQEEGTLGNWGGNVGLRIVNTDNNATGQLVINPVQAGLSANQCIAANGASACSFLINALTFASGGTKNSYVYHNSYTDFLPSFNLRFGLSNKSILRFAGSKAIVRPSFSQMVPYTSLSYGIATDGYSPTLTNSITGTGGNPYLKPTKVWEFDASYEYYWGRSNQFSAALFYKDVSDYIFQGVSNESYTSNGVTQTFAVTRNMNGSHGTIKGLELSYQQFFDFLPGAFSGLGFQGNFTYVDANGGKNTAVNILDSNQTSNASDQNLPLEGMSKYAFNVAGMYQKAGFEGRVAYNWRSTYLLTTSAANLNAPVWWEASGQLDASVFYSLTKGIKLGVQATNLLASRAYLDVGGAALHPRYSWTDSDRRFAFLARVRF